MLIKGITMIVYTRSAEFAESILGSPLTLDQPTETSDALRSLDSEASVYRCKPVWAGSVQHLVCVEHAEQSQYDRICGMLKENIDIPHKAVAIAGSGARFHGLRNRHWESPRGNIYMTVCYRPNRVIEKFGPGFVALPAVSVVDAVDRIESLKGRAKIKWVNDILVDGAKISGVLTFSQGMGSEVTGVVLGIGLNVEVVPEIEPTETVRKVACINDFADNAVRMRDMLSKSIEALDRNYEILIDGGCREIIDRYRRNSDVVGRKVRILSDGLDSEKSVLAEGVVESIGDDLEIYLGNQAQSIYHGRLSYSD